MSGRDSDRRRPIGVFDSGLGGLTVFRALRRRLPRESLTYFGDTEHVPYGSKSKEAVAGFSLSIGRFLEKQRIKALVVACNTASALALPELKRSLGVPVIGVIEPGVRAAVAAGGRSIGVIATEATIASGAYQERLRSATPGVRIVGAACPLFVPLVEEGWWTHAVTRAVAAEYLRPLRRARVETLILGCTHYPLLKPVLRRTMGAGVRLIDSAEEIAVETREMLDGIGLLAPKGPARERFFASDGADRFRRLARRFLGTGVPEVTIHRLEA